VLADPNRFAASEAVPAEPNPAATAEQSLRDAVPFATSAIAYDPATHAGVVLLAQGSGLDLTSALRLEQGLRARQKLEGTEVVPPLQPLPPIAVTLAAHAPPALGPNLALDAWAVKRWQVAKATATVCGRGQDAHVRTALETALAASLAPAKVETTAGTHDVCRAAAGRGLRIILTPG
jgi:hypothetical protein